jgi:hypothetical protein
VQVNSSTLSLDSCPHCGAFDLVTRGGRTECLRCKKVMLLADLTACSRCGEVLPSAAAACDRCTQAPPATGRDAPAELKGVGGWLLVLAVYLLAMGPLAFVLQVVRISSWIDAAVLVPGFRAFAWTSLGIEAAITGALAVGGAQIFAMRPGAVRFCQRALVIAPLAALAELGAGYLFMDAAVFARFLPIAAIGASRTGLVALGWLAYLQASRRVRNTFPER